MQWVLPRVCQEIQMAPSSLAHAGHRGGVHGSDNGESHGFCSLKRRQANHRGSHLPCQKGQMHDFCRCHVTLHYSALLQATLLEIHAKTA